MQIHTTPCEFLLIPSAKRRSEFTGVSHLDIIPSFLISSSYSPVFFCHLGIIFEVEEVVGGGGKPKPPSLGLWNCQI